MDNKTQERLQELFIKYTKKLPSKLHELQEKWQDLKQHYTKTKLEGFHREIHTLCGSAGTYGYVELSKSARNLEIYLKNLLDCEAISVEQISAISDLMQQLQNTTLTPDEGMFFSTDKAPNENKLIYVLDDDVNFVTELRNELFDSGYELQRVDNISDLIASIRQKEPVTLIVDVAYLNPEAIQELQELQTKYDIVVPLFCTATSGGITERLRAIHAGSSVFVRKPVDTFYLEKMLDQIVGLTTTEPFRILIVDDSPHLAEYYSFILQESGMTVRSLSHPLQTLDVIAEFRPDLLLLDIYMPECSGIELAAILRQEPKYTHIPIIFLSSEEDKFKQLAALNLGGDDFLTKPILPQHLVAAVKSRAKRAGILSSYMMRDSLTGLLNHSHILHQLEIELMRAQRHYHPLTFAMIDIDNFKQINDQYGHMIGDRVLKKLSELLTTRLRKSDYVGRYGGEEFAIILPNTKISAAKKIMEDLRKKFAQSHFVGENFDFTVSFSVGIASFAKIPNTQLLIEAADHALYKAKHGGRNRVVLF